jgi:hypothetical protein
MPSCWLINDQQLKPIKPVDACLTIPHNPHLQGTVPNIKVLPSPTAVSMGATFSFPLFLRSMSQIMLDNTRHVPAPVMGIAEIPSCRLEATKW